MAERHLEIPREQRIALEERAKQRALLKREYIKQMTNPHRHATGEGGVLFDPGVQRYMALRATQYDHFRATPKSSMYGIGIVVLPIVIYTYAIWKERSIRENNIRTGQIAYKDRRFKFI